MCVLIESGSASLPVPSGDKNALRRVIDFVRETSDDSLRDINRKLQRVLEETLTKNMHLQEVTFTLLNAFIDLKVSIYFLTIDIFAVGVLSHGGFEFKAGLEKPVNFKKTLIGIVLETRVFKVHLKLSSDGYCLMESGMSFLQSLGKPQRYT